MTIAKRRILITGAGSGIGRALALAAADRGMHVALCGRRTHCLEEVLARMPGSGHLVTPCDVLDPRQRMSLLEEIGRVWGGLDILVNNAGLVSFGPLRTLADREITDLVGTNLVAPICMARDFVPLLQSGCHPQIANMGSLLGSIPYPLFTAYAATKSGLHAFSTALRRELAPLGIAVTHVSARGAQTASAHKLDAYAKPLEMHFDPPEALAHAVLDGIARRKAEIFPKGMERIYLAAQAFAPALVDQAIARQMRRASADGLTIV
jgi:short-subunit dehydrogenase